MTPTTESNAAEWAMEVEEVKRRDITTLTRMQTFWQ
jgi:hypothetical protein